MIPAKNKNNSNYLNFDKSRMTNLEYSLKREILRTNRRGAYHCTSIAECNTRKQHGLLVMPVTELGGTNHVLLSSFSETIIQYGAEFHMGINKYDGDHYSPQGHKYIREFTCDSVPKLIYRVGGVIFSKEKMFSLTDNTIFIRYTLLDAHSPTTIRFNPFLAFREVNSLTYENQDARLGYKEIENGISMCMYAGYPNLYMQFNKPNVKFVFEPRWYRGIEYIRDMEEGLPYKEDLYVPGYFEFPIVKGETIIFSASDTLVDVNSLENQFEEGIKARTPRSSFYNCLKNSAHQFYYRPRKGETYILNSYPWGKVTAREQFMALEGLTLSIGKPDICEEVFDTSIPLIRAYMKGEPMDTLLEGLDDPDAPFWLFKAIKAYSRQNKEKFEAKYLNFVFELISYITNNEHPRLRLMGNMLLHTDGRLKPASWMNGMIDGKPVVPRTGYLVEINVFWHDALMFAAELAAEFKKPELLKEMREMAEKVKSSFYEMFVNKEGYLFDFVDGYKVDWSVRPNMLYAVASEYSLLDRREARSIMDIATRELATTKGLRTLSPKSDGFCPRYEGSRDEKQYAAFNGTARMGLIITYLEAYLKVSRQRGVSFLERMLAGVEEEMGNDCIGTLSEIYDGNMPSWGHGAISSAIDVAGVLRALKIVNTIANEY